MDGAAEVPVDGHSPTNRLTRPLAGLLDEVPADWAPLVQRWRLSQDGQALLAHVEARRQSGAVIYPGTPFKALALTPLAQVKVVILGQDPYHGPGQAEGLAFSVPRGTRLPPSLRNIFAELRRDLGLPAPEHGHLGHWARRGVLLLNTVLTVEHGRPASHAKRGWEALTDALIESVARESRALVFMLWGAHAQAKRALIEGAGDGRHALLLANHPSPLSARRPPLPFIGCGHFGAALRAGLCMDWATT